MIHCIDNPVIEYSKDRKDGISAFLRVKNGADYLKPSILSIINDVDELICVNNQSSDTTLEILAELQKQYPHIHIYDYKPIVYPPGSIKYQTNIDSINTFAHLSNFALSKTNFNYLFKFDDDEIFFPGIIPHIHSLCMKNNNTPIGMRGINLVDVKNKLFINREYLATDGRDTIFFKYDDYAKFIQDKRFEIFEHKDKDKTKSVVDCFYHLKFCKPDRGFNNYEISNNRYININTKFLKSLNKENLIPLEKARLTYPDPYDLGFYIINNSQKIYKNQIYSLAESNLR